MLAAPGRYAVDTECTGLRAYHGDRLFSLIIASAEESWYFNFQEYAGLAEDWVLPRGETFAALAPFFGDARNTLFFSNAKFDLAMLAAEGVTVAGQIQDVEVLGRLLYNRHMTYGLGDQVARIGLEKSSEVDDYIKAHDLWTWVSSPGKEKRSKQPHYDRVPFPIISRYGEQDGAVTRQLGEHQLSELAALSAIIPGGKLLELIDNESQLVKVCFAMEQTGIRIDRAYCQRAYEHELARAAAAGERFAGLAGEPLVDSGKALARAFDKLGEAYPKTEKGNPSFTDEVLEAFTTPLAQVVRDYRTASKRATTYFANFLYFADAGDRIHPNMRQAGTDTGRFSYSDPNLQNVPKDESGEDFPVRRAFVPDGPDWLLVAIDYQAMEFRLLLDYAGELGVIRRIKDEGLDVHQATADQMGVSRSEAKTLNFGLLYGMGADKLAHALGITLAQAKRLKDRYFDALPAVRAFTYGVMERANTRGFIFDWAGRVLHFPWCVNPRTGKQDRFAYKANNHLIQGGCADIVRRAMVRCHARLAGCQSKMLLQVHDELVYLVHKSELAIVPELRKIMETAYEPRHLPLTCSVEWSATSWADKRPWSELGQ